MRAGIASLHSFRPWRALRQRLDVWLFPLKPAEQGEVVLHQRRVFILPTRAGMAYVLMLLGLFIGSVNYNLNMGFSLTFLAAGCALVGVYLTFRNLAFLRLTPGRCPSVFAGGQAQFGLVLANQGRHARYAISLVFLDEAGQAPEITVDVPPYSENQVQLATPAPARGWLKAPRIRLQTTFPLGLLRAWSYWTPDMSVLVYPEPEAHAPPLPASATGERDGSGRAGQDDFAGVRNWQAGDPPSRLAWRQIARLDSDSALVSKAFEGGMQAELCLDEGLLMELPPEARLSRLTRWVLEADARGLAWRLALGRHSVAASSGPAHRDECLRLLALYPRQAP